VGFQALSDGDVLTIGDTKFRVRVVEPKVVAKSSSTPKSAVATILPATPPKTVPDLIDIQATEGSQRWRVAEDLDNLEKAGAGAGKPR
ncbi:MAG: hypothetical protein AAB214_13325, partial [Fibrobacterota bacterium]